jgi:Transposase
MAVRKRDDEVIFPNAAGIDVGGSSHWVAVPKHSCDDPVREFGAMTADLNAMADWLFACGVDTVALESTGVYWIPVYEVLEQRGLKLCLVDARQMKYVPGRKSAFVNGPVTVPALQLSTFTLPSFTTRAHLACSLVMKAANLSRVPPPSSAP